MGNEAQITQLESEVTMKQQAFRRSVDKLSKARSELRRLEGLDREHRKAAKQSGQLAAAKRASDKAKTEHKDAYDEYNRANNALIKIKRKSKKS